MTAARRLLDSSRALSISDRFAASGRSFVRWLACQRHTEERNAFQYHATPRNVFVTPPPITTQYNTTLCYTTQHNTTQRNNTTPHTYLEPGTVAPRHALQQPDHLAAEEEPLEEVDDLLAQVAPLPLPPRHLLHHQRVQRLAGLLMNT